MDKLWVPRFLHENRVRRGLSTLYVGLVGSSENAEALLANEFGKIKKENSKGNLLTKRCFNASIRWLRFLQEFSIDHAIFSNQVLEPARSSARFILRARKERHRSASTSGLLIRRSKPFFDQYYGTNVLTLSFVLPELGSVSSLRCRIGGAPSNEYGLLKISGIQPVPFVNRMHPTKLELRPLTHEVDIAEFDFLKISCHDLSKFDQCLAFENFCEIWSEQEEGIRGRHGRRLGMPFIVGGIALPTAGPYLTLRSIADELSTSQLFVTKQFLKLLERQGFGLGQINGKLLRILGVAWYRYGSRKSTPEYHEAVVPQLADDPDEILVDDVVGFVRMRDHVSSSAIDAMYGEIDYSSLPSSLEFRNDRVHFTRISRAKDPISKIHVEETDRIRLLRREVDPFAPEGIFDTRKLRIEGLSDWLRYKKHVFDSLLALIRYSDSEAYLPLKKGELVKAIQEKSLFALDQEKCVDALNWLYHLGLFQIKKNELPFVKKRGIEVALSVVKQSVAAELKRIGKRQEIITLQQLELDVKVPIPLVLMVLQDLEKNGLMDCSMVNGKRCELFWLSPKAKTTDCGITAEAKRLERIVLDALNADARVPLHPSGILKNIRRAEFRMSHAVLRIVLTMLQDEGRIHRKPEHDLWEYPRKNRIADVIKEHPMQCWALDEITAKISLAPLDIHIRSVEALLRELENEGLAIEILPERWTKQLPEREDRERRHSLFRSECRRHILGVLSENPNGVPRERLLSESFTFMSSIKKKLCVSGSSIMIANQIIEQMLENKEILSSEDRLSLPTNKA